MEIRCEALIPYPKQLVWSTYRDRLPEIVAYLPNIRRIESKERYVESGGQLVRLVNEWHGGGDIPAVARAVLSESMLSWTDRAAWDQERFVCDWQVVPHWFSEAVQSQGFNRYQDTEGGTLLQVRGELHIDGTQIKAIPRLFASKVSRAVEEFMCKLVEKNLAEASRALSRFLDAQQSR